MRNNPKYGVNQDADKEIRSYVIKIQKKRILDSKAKDIRNLFVSLYHGESVQLDEMDKFVKKVHEVIICPIAHFGEYFYKFARELRLNNINVTNFDEVYNIFVKWVLESFDITLEMLEQVDFTGKCNPLLGKLAITSINSPDKEPKAKALLLRAIFPCGGYQNALMVLED